MNKEQVESLEQHLNLLIETSRQLGIMASNFQDQSQNEFNKKFTMLSNCLKNLDMMKDNFAEIKVPVSVFKYLSLYFHIFLFFTLSRF